MGEGGVGGSVNGICVATMLHGRVMYLGYIVGYSHSRLERTEVARLATERARKRARNEIALVVGVSIAISTVIWLFLSILP